MRRRLGRKPTLPTIVGLVVKPIGKPSAGNRHARFAGSRGLTLDQKSPPRRFFAWTLKPYHRCLVPVGRDGMLNIMSPQMNSLASAIVALAVVTAPGLTTVPAVAQTKMDCSRLYKDFWEKMDREKYAKISAEQLAGVSRWALRAYDACQAGDDVDAKVQFDNLNKLAFWF